MTKLNRGAAWLMLVAGAMSAGLSGCRHHHGSWGRDGFRSDSHSESGSISISKMGGGIDLDSAPHGATLSTMGGEIHVVDVGSYLKAKTMGGGIDVDRSAGSVDVATMGGDITIGSANGPIKASTMGGEIRARMVGTSSGGERDIDLTSHGGTITLRVPKDFPMEVQITLVHTQNAPREYHIDDHIGLEQRDSEDWDDSKGTPRKYLRAKGQVGDGSNHVTINTINGDVILKQE